MPRSHALVSLTLITLLTVLPACKRSYAKAPYQRGDAPAPAALLAATSPRYASLRVPKAKIREGRSLAARLLILAESPSRMLGTIEVAGNPLVTLALSEQAYGLRTVREAPGLAAGFYTGPPSRCAVSSLLGVDLDPEQVVSLLLGGGPLIDGPHEVVEQRWHKGRERLVIRNERYRQTLDFVWVDGAWWFAAARLEARSSGDPQWLWTIVHEELELQGTKVLPAKTRIRRPGGKKGSVELSITYAKQVVTPIGEATEPPVDSSDTAEPGWDDEGWDDEGWDDEGGATATAAAEKSPPTQTQVPSVYRLQPNGLPHRGDLCRRSP